MLCLCGRPVDQVLVIKLNIEVTMYEAMAPQYGRSGFKSWLSQWIEAVTCEDMTPNCWRSLVQVLNVSVDIRVATYKVMTPQYGRSGVQVMFVRVDKGALTYEIQVWEVRVSAKWVVGVDI